MFQDFQRKLKGDQNSVAIITIINIINTKKKAPMIIIWGIFILKPIILNFPSLWPVEGVILRSPDTLVPHLLQKSLLGSNSLPQLSQ